MVAHVFNVRFAVNSHTEVCATRFFKIKDSKNRVRTLKRALLRVESLILKNAGLVVNVDCSSAWGISLRRVASISGARL